MDIVSSSPVLSLTEESFPCALHNAVSLTQAVPPSHENDELTFSLVERIEQDEDKHQFSAEVDIKRWRFRCIQHEWILTEILHQITVEAPDLPLLVHAFSAAASAARSSAKILYLENSRETATIFYGFDWPLNGAGLVVAYIPPEILAVCRCEAIRLGYELSA